MRALALTFLSLGLSLPALALEKRPRLEQDECARKSADCERSCALKSDLDRLSCKTDCRLAESECRHQGRR